jgi:hypothetical protein
MMRSVPNLPLQGNCDVSQERDIHEIFKSHGYGVWIPLPKFPHLHEFNRAVHNLRWRDDLNIQNRTERVTRPDGRKGTNSFYRLLPGSWRELGGKPEQGYAKREAPTSSFSAPKPSKSWEQVCAERDEKTRQPEPEWSLTP